MLIIWRLMNVAGLLVILAACAQSPLGAGSSAYAVSNNQNCFNCGTVTDIRIVESKPQSSGVGMIIGAVVGAAAGREVSNDEDDKQGAIAGAAAGAAAGHEIERRKGQYYQVVVAMDNGGYQNIYLQYPPSYGVGSRVQVTNPGNPAPPPQQRY